ncbi:hypothetical protein CDL12_14218 [Handroanthus impetiginosus]|uniref:Uncharacterized protein n=1 Tax=Handroanthus impetiginosus TaxID=429701 RepID=A0A2G9H6L4_9LAMI|nr:hypothetical protein CDL12_14218 [Handroanthus impetiginosus]
MKSRKDGRIEITTRNKEMAEQKFYGFTKTRWIETKKRYRRTYHESTDFCRFRYCCWIGRRACFYWTWSWSRNCCGSSRRGYRETARGRGTTR